MNRRIQRAVVFALACAPAAAQQAEPPRLVVLCSVDQLAHWVFEQARPHFAADGVHANFMPVCWGPSFLPSRAGGFASTVTAAMPTDSVARVAGRG